MSWLGYDARPAAVKTSLAYSLQRLRTDHIDVYRPARLDPQVPIEETIGAIAEMVQAGYVRFIGLSEVGSETIRRAAAVHPICDLQIEYSLISRGIEREILGTCRELGDRDHRLRRALPRPDQRPLVARAQPHPDGLPQPGATLPGREPGAQPASWSTRCGPSPTTSTRASHRSRSPGCCRAARTSSR